jgi:DNA-binding CsgD family transcriptional regulator
MRLIALGQVNKQVATALGISPKTVNTSTPSAGVTTRAGAALVAVGHGLLAP